MRFPEQTDRLINLNLPHPQGLMRELAHNPEQQKNSQYARDFQQPDAASKITPEFLTFWVRDEAAKAKYLEAFRRSSLEGMLNYYKANYPRAPYQPRLAAFSECLRFLDPSGMAGSFVVVSLFDFSLSLPIC